MSLTTVAYKKAKAEAEAEAEAEVNTGTKKKEKYYWRNIFTKRARHSNVGTTTSITPSRPQSSRIARPISSSARGRTALRTGTTSKIPQAIPSPNRSRSTTPAISRSPSSSSRPTTPSFSQSAETINVFINYIEPDYQE
ncbi:4469_t:CDS:2 [Funneliformis mosseae]|uniref:4469_t:CDS:1 n=1 Tax=Funneliformis mosseae TaxID=27381 RepID=A0A9N9EHC8_FUNMO|nr:4469_t:CDS:2 [Funneliformis mosseae]